MARLRAKREKPTGKRRGRLKGFYAEFYSADQRPKQIRFSLRTKDEQAARAKLLRLERAYAAGEFDPWAGDRDINATTGVSATILEASGEYVESRSLSLAKSSIDTDTSVLRSFARSLPPGILVSHVRRDHVDSFLNGVANPSTRNSYRERLRGFFRWATDRGYCKGGDVVPPKGKGRQERREQLPRFFSEDELALVLQHLSEDGSSPALTMRDIVTFAVGTGLRRAEICALRWEAVSMEDSIVRVSHTEDAAPKSGRERAVPLVGDALAVIHHRERKKATSPFVFPGAGGAKLNGQYLGKRFAEYRKRSGVRDGLTFHGLRHTFGTYAVRRGMDVYRLKEIMGHADIKTTMKYARLRPASLRPDMERCFGGGLLPNASTESATRQELERLRAEIAMLRSAAGERAGSLP